MWGIRKGFDANLSSIGTLKQSYNISDDFSLYGISYPKNTVIW